MGDSGKDDKESSWDEDSDPESKHCRTVKSLPKAAADKETRKRSGSISQLSHHQARDSASGAPEFKVPSKESVRPKTSVETRENLTRDEIYVIEIRDAMREEPLPINAGIAEAAILVARDEFEVISAAEVDASLDKGKDVDDSPVLGGEVDLEALEDAQFPDTADAKIKVPKPEINPRAAEAHVRDLKDAVVPSTEDLQNPSSQFQLHASTATEETSRSNLPRNTCTPGSEEDSSLPSSDTALSVSDDGCEVLVTDVTSTCVCGFPLQYCKCPPETQ